MNMKLEDLTYALMISLLDTKGPSIYYVSTFSDISDPLSQWLIWGIFVQKVFETNLNFSYQRENQKK